MKKFVSLTMLAAALVLGIAIETEAGPLRRLFGRWRSNAASAPACNSCSGGSCAVR